MSENALDVINNTKVHKTLGITVTLAEKNKVVATMEVTERVHQPMGLLHGGISVVLAESVASIGGWMNIDMTKEQVVGLEINANHIRAVKSGVVTATATPIHIGRKTQLWGIELTREDGKVTCVSRCTLSVIPLEYLNK